MGGEPWPWVALLLGYGSLALFAWSFYDAWRWPALTYRIADRLFRGVWLTTFAAAMVLQIWNGVWRPGEENTGRVLAWIASLVIVVVYVVDVRPRLRDADAAADGRPS